MPVRNALPYSKRCESCGAQKLPGSALCPRCKARRERSFGAPGRAVAIPPLETLARTPDEHEQARAMQELGRCGYCGTPHGGHLASCWGRVLDLDVTSEYRDAADSAEESL